MVRPMKTGRHNRYAKAATIAALIAATVAGQATSAVAGVVDTFYERSFVLAANDRCRLFAPVVTSALTAAALQARGAAARSGANDVVLGQTAARARSRAALTACNDPDLVIVRGRVTEAFAGWARTPRMSFPGVHASWSADRSGFSSPTWRLMQASVTGASPVAFGYSAGGGQGETLKAVVSWHGRPRPYAARLVLRDAERAPRPWLVGRGVLPPEPQRRVFFSSGSGEAEQTLLTRGKTEGQAWTFPAAAAEALARLDPREPFVIEFVFRDDSVTRATFEAGDFGAGRAFIGMGSL